MVTERIPGAHRGIGTAVALVAGGLPAAAAQDQPVTYAADVAPILYEHCAVCHRPGGPGPFSVFDIAQVRERSALIAEYTRTRYMPPWLPAPDHVRFAGERLLTERELDVITSWVADGAPEGEMARLPPAPESAEGWPLGEPDLVVRLPAFQRAAGGTDVYRNLVVPIPLTETRHVTSVDIRPGGTGTVHHARLMVDTTASSRQYDALDAAPGFDGMEIVSNADNPPGTFLGWTPGRVPYRGDPDMAWRLEPGTDLVLQVHLPPTDRPQTIAPEVALYFATDTPRRFPALVMLGSESLDIPAGDSAYVVTDTYELPVPVDVLGVYPHAHYLGSRIEGFANLPDGSQRWLILIEDWDFNWQDEYRLADPIPLPAGTTLVMRFTYDNSAGNPQNPSDPPRRVVYGSQSTDEMADLVIQVLPPDREAQRALVEDHRWTLYLKEIDRQFAMLVASGDSLAALGDAESALARYRDAQLLKADDLGLHLAMGNVLIPLGRPEDAMLHFRRAVQLNPRSSRALAAVSRLLATHPDPAQRSVERAVRFAERAVDASGRRDPIALEALAIALEAGGESGRARESATAALRLARVGTDDVLIDRLRELVARLEGRQP